MNVLNLYSAVINSGIRDQHPHTFSDKLKSRNKLAFACIGFSLVYFALFLKEFKFIPFLAISVSILLFAISIYLNSKFKYTVSSILIIINTNYCVLFFSTYLGMASGIHLYLLTSPLIVLTAFDTKNVKLLSLAMSSYLVNYIIISVADKYTNSASDNFLPETINLFYFINFSFTLFLLMVLSFYFFYNNNRTNGLLIIRNEELRKRQAEIALENRIRKEAEIKATQALSEKELLLSEIHHRVKNNLAVISGLLEIHTINVQNIGIIKVIRQCQNRIKSMAILHEKLYENKSLKEIDVKDFVLELLEYIGGTYSITGKEVAFEVNIDATELDMAKAMPFGLLINELISNSYKHAFKHHTGGIIYIDFRRNGTEYELIYRDNGTGFSYTNDPNRASLGLTLIETFSQQLHGTYSFSPHSQGMLFKIKFID